MKHLPLTLLIIIAALQLGIYFASERIEQLEKSIHATEQVKRAHNEAKRAEAMHQQAMQIDTIRDTLYLTRVRTQIEWRELIQTTPPDSVVYVRLDSCIGVGAIELKELALCDSANTLKDSAILAYSNAVAGIDSVLVKTQANAVRFKRQRNWAIGAAVAALIVGVVR